MNEERVQILKMLQEGRITVEEAAKLIDALSASGPAPVEPRAVAIPIEEVGQAVDQRPADGSGGAFRYGFCSNLENARFDEAQVGNGKIWFCNLDGANLQNANLENAWVIGDNLDGVNLEGANLEGAKVVACNLDHADLAGADLSGAVLIGANLERVRFRGANLRGRVLIGVNLASMRDRPNIVPVVTKE